jgi:hypothetical protein
MTATPKIGQCYSDIDSCRAQMGESYCTQSGIEGKKIGERSSEKFVLNGDVVEYNLYTGSLDCSSTPTVQTAKLYVCANNVRLDQKHSNDRVTECTKQRNITLTDKPLQYQIKGSTPLVNSWAIVGQGRPWIWIISFALALFVLL